MLSLCKSLTFAVWALFLGWLVTWGRKDLAYFLHPRLFWVDAAGAVVLVLFLVATLKEGGKGAKKTLPELPAMLVLFVPLAFFPLARNVQLDSSVLQSRLQSGREEENQVVNDASAAQESEFVAEAFSPDPGAQASSLDAFDESDTDAEDRVARRQEKGAPQDDSEIPLSDVVFLPEEYHGKEATVVCKTATDSRLAKGTLLCYRYLITCCIADAQPVYLLLKQAEEVPLVPEKWVKIKGKISYTTYRGYKTPIMEPDACQYVSEPDFPWIF